MIDPDLLPLLRTLTSWTTDAALILGFALVLGRMERAIRKGESIPPRG